MNAKTKLILAAIVIVILVISVYLFSKPYSWQETYDLKEDEPYDLSLLKNVLEKSTSEKQFIEINTSDTVYDFLDLEQVPPNSNLISFGNNLYLDSLDMEKLMQITEQGHNVYLFSQRFHRKLLQKLLIPAYYTSEDEEYWDDEVQDYLFYEKNDFLDDFSDSVCVYSLHEEYSPNFKPIETKKRIGEKIAFKNWTYFRNGIEQKEAFTLEKLGSQNTNHTNFIRIKNGDGYFYLHCSPFAFTNFNFIREDFFDYSTEVFKDLGNGAIYWDQYLNQNHYNPINFETSSDNESAASNNLEDGPLTFILSEPGLRWAWYFILIAIVLYLVFGVRRKQSPIPVLKANKNTSIEYAETIGGLYFQKKDHHVLIDLKMRQFKTFVHNTYGVRMKYDNPIELEKIKEKIAMMSDIEKDKLDTIYNEYESLMKSNKVNSGQLVKFHDNLDDFYKNCK